VNPVLNRQFGRFLATMSVLFTGTLVTSGLAMVTQVLLARLLITTDYGEIAALLAAINFLTPIGSAGVSIFLLQVFGREHAAAKRWFRSSAILVALTSSLSALALTAYVFSGEQFGEMRPFILLYSIPILLGQIMVELTSARFQLEDRYGALAIWQTCTQLGRFATLMLAAALSINSINFVLGGYAGIAVLVNALGLLFWRGLSRNDLRLGYVAPATPSAKAPQSRPSVLQTLKEAGPFALVTVFYVVNAQGATVILNWLAGAAAAALFNVAYLIVATICLVPQVIYLKFLISKLCRWAEHDRRTFAAAFHVGLPAMLLLGLLFWGAIVVSAKWIIMLLFGARYAGAEPSLIILALVIPVRFAQVTYGSLFINGRETTQKVTYMGLSAAITFILNALLVPSLGVVGAAIANVIGETAMLGLYVYGTAHHILGIDVAATFRPSTFKASLNRLGHLRT
jgi:O-antigen/teichoic acid export membrane protein